MSLKFWLIACLLLAAYVGISVQEEQEESEDTPKEVEDTEDPGFAKCPPYYRHVCRKVKYKYGCRYGYKNVCPCVRARYYDEDQADNEDNPDDTAAAADTEDPSYRRCPPYHRPKCRKVKYIYGCKYGYRKICPCVRGRYYDEDQANNDEEGKTDEMDMTDETNDEMNSDKDEVQDSEDPSRRGCKRIRICRYYYYNYRHRKYCRYVTRCYGGGR